MSKNKLKLNDDKTEFLICGSACSLKKVKTEHIKIGDQLVKNPVMCGILVLFSMKR